LHAGLARWSLLRRRRRLHRVRPLDLLNDVEVHLLDLVWRWIVAAVEPVEDGRVTREAAQLIAQRVGGDLFVLGVPILPLLPVIAATPSREHEDAHAVAELEEVLVFEFAFEAHGIEVHVLDVAEFGFLPLGRTAQQHVERVARAADQDVLAVDLEEPVSIRELAGDFADAEVDMRSVAGFAPDLESEVERIQVLWTGESGPPQSRARDLLGDMDDAGLVGADFDGLRELLPLDLAAQDAFDGRIERVDNLRADGEVGGVGSEVRDDARISDRGRAGSSDPNVAPDAHELIGRQRVPIDEGDAQVAGRGREDLDGERVVAGLDGGGDVEREQTPRARDLLRIGDLLTVEPDIGAEVDAVEAEPDDLAVVIRQREGGAEPPGLAERAVLRHGDVGEVDTDVVLHAGRVAEVHAEVGVGVLLRGDERAEDGAARGRGVPAGGAKSNGGEGGAGLADVGGRLDCPSLA